MTLDKTLDINQKAYLAQQRTKQVRMKRFCNIACKLWLADEIPTTAYINILRKNNQSVI
jgi:hypothetical protein